MAQYLRSLYRFRSQVVMDQRAFTMLYASEQLDYGTYISDYPTTHEIGLGVSERASERMDKRVAQYLLPDYRLFKTTVRRGGGIVLDGTNEVGRT